MSACVRSIMKRQVPSMYRAISSCTTVLDAAPEGMCSRFWWNMRIFPFGKRWNSWRIVWGWSCRCRSLRRRKNGNRTTGRCCWRSTVRPGSIITCCCAVSAGRTHWNISAGASWLMKRCRNSGWAMQISTAMICTGI